MLKKAVISIFCLNTLMLYPQGFVSRIYLPHSQNMMTQAIYETTPGNYIGAGVSWDSINGQVISNLVMMGLNSTGQLIWTKKYTGFNVNTLVLRTFYRRGNYLYRVGVGLDSNNKNFGTLLKIDMNGDTLWQKKYYDATDGCIPQIVTGSVDGGLLLTGFFEGAQTNCLLIKTNANGDELWRKKISKFSPNSSDGQSIIQDSATKKIVITGYQYLANISIADNVLVTDSLGNNPIRTSYLTNSGGNAKDMIQCRNKKCVVVGHEYFPQTIGGTNLRKSYVAQFDLNNSLTPVWKVNLGKLTLSNAFGCIRENSNRVLFILGTIDTLRMLNINDNHLISLVKLDTNGQIKFHKLYNYKTNTDSFPNYLSTTSLELTSDGGCVVSIVKQNNLKPNPFIFIKYDANGCDSTSAHCATLNLVGGKELRMKNEELRIYPNPASEIINVECEILNGFDANKTQIKITDISGREIQNFSIHDQKKISINTKNYQAGIYFISLIIDGIAIETKKLMIVR